MVKNMNTTSPKGNGIAYMGGFHLLLDHLPKKVGFAFRDIVFLEKIKKSLFPFFTPRRRSLALIFGP